MGQEKEKETVERELKIISDSSPTDEDALIAWYRVHKAVKKEKIERRSNIVGLCIGLGTAFIVWLVFGEVLPEWLIERHRKSKGGTTSLLELLGVGVGVLLGKGISKVVLKLMKLDK